MFKKKTFTIMRNNYFLTEPNFDFENCAEIIVGQGGVWNDVSCSNNQPAICEKRGKCISFFLIPVFLSFFLCSSKFKIYRQSWLKGTQQNDPSTNQSRYCKCISQGIVGILKV